MLAGMCSGLLAMGVGFQAHGLECGGRVVGWNGSSGIDPELTAGFGHHVTAIAAGGIYYAGLRADGTVALGQGNTYFMGAVPPTPNKLRGVKAIFGAKQLFLPNMFVIKTDGAVTGWGVNDYGQLNIPLAAQSGGADDGGQRGSGGGDQGGWLGVQLGAAAVRDDGGGSQCFLGDGDSSPESGAGGGVERV